MVLFLVVLYGVMSGTGLAADPPPGGNFRIPPREPAEALKTFQVLHGFRLELVAHEPQITDPVDVAYDEDHRAFVVEMRDYPYPEEMNAPPKEFLGQVRLLEDRNQDGVYETSSVFADQLAWPTSVACWRGGVFVAAAPDLWYFKDENGDGRAEIRERVFTGFGRYNVQAIMNNLRWGLDNRICGAASGNAGQVQRVDQPLGSAVSLSGRDFSFDPATREFAAIPGGARFGNSFDDWGHRFVCNIRNPVQQVMFPPGALLRNPALTATQALHDAAESGDQLPVFRTSPPEAWRMFRARQWTAERINYPRSELIGAGFWTSSSGVTVYRGSAYPAAFRGNVFVGEVAGNLVHRQVLDTSTLAYRSKRADEQAEFVTSTDNWFRPVNFVNASDGTLHILDMYRETIEHPWSIPDDIKARLNLSSGNDRGRIYRLCPPNFKYAPPQRLGLLSSTELVALLEHANSWHRETAQRLLYERQDKTVVPALRSLLQDSPNPLGRLHALWSLAGLHSLEEADVIKATADSHPQIRRHGIYVSQLHPGEWHAAQSRILELARDADQEVRFQAALALAESADPRRPEALAALATRDARDPWMRTAILGASYEAGADVLTRLLNSPEFDDRAGGVEFVQELAAIVASRAKPAEVRAVVQAMLELSKRPQSLDFGFAVIGGLQRGLQRNRQKLRDVIAEDADALRGVDQLLQQAAAAAAAEDGPVTQRVQALRLLGERPFPEMRELFAAELRPQQPREVQLAALATLRGYADAPVADLLLDSWVKATPPVRQEMVEVLLSRGPWVPQLLTAVESGRVPPSQIGIPQRARLLKDRDPEVQRRSTAIFGPNAVSSRKEALDRYQPALQLKPDLERGRVVFRRECVTCHRLGNEGHEVGPNLLTVRHRSTEEMLTHILDPNREVPPQFLSYQAVLKDGRIIQGVILSESETGLTFQRAENVRETVLRSDIDELASTRVSLMPEGLEQKIAIQEMADLLAYLKEGR